MLIYDGYTGVGIKRRLAIVLQMVEVDAKEYLLPWQSMTCKYC